MSSVASGVEVEPMRVGSCVAVSCVLEALGAPAFVIAMGRKGLSAAFGKRVQGKQVAKMARVNTSRRKLELGDGSQ